MKFISTREVGEPGQPTKLYSLEEAVLKGWADDGGMLMPTELPNLEKELRDWSESNKCISYKDLTIQILSLFIDKTVIDEDELAAIVQDAFKRFDIDEIISLQKLNTTNYSTYVAELWHGPTLAFKDLSMQVLCGFMEKLLAKKRQKIKLLVGTSGDTGASSIEGVLGKENLSVCVLYPSRSHSSITREQEFETVCHAEAPNVTVVCCEGNSDDLDVPIEECFRDLEFKAHANISSVNSVNIFRVIMQVVHYFYCYLLLNRSEKAKELSFYVPSGGCGHCSAGILAAQMGLPIHSIVACVNQNDVLDSLLKRGNLDSNPKVVPTLAPSMDIVVPYNLERILFLMSNQNRSKVRQWMNRWKGEGKVELTEGERKVLSEVLRLRSASMTDKEILDTIFLVEKEFSYIIDPHTAVAVGACLSDEGSPGKVPRVCMGCAHPGKFSKAVSDALGGAPPVQWMPNREHPAVADILQLLETSSNEEKAGVHYFVKGQDWTKQLRDILTT